MTWTRFYRKSTVEIKVELKYLLIPRPVFQVQTSPITYVKRGPLRNLCTIHGISFFKDMLDLLSFQVLVSVTAKAIKLCNVPQGKGWKPHCLNQWFQNFWDWWTIINSHQFSWTTRHSYQTIIWKTLQRYVGLHVICRLHGPDNFFPDNQTFLVPYILHYVNVIFLPDPGQGLGSNLGI